MLCILVLQFQFCSNLTNTNFSFPIYSILTIEWQMQWLMMVFELRINLSFDTQHISRTLFFVWMGIHVNTVLCMQDLRTLIRYYFDIKIYIWEHLELELKSKLKLSNMYTYMLYHTYVPYIPYIGWAYMEDVSHIYAKSLLSTNWQGALHTYLTYITR